jgi:hypothetical protein
VEALECAARRARQQVRIAAAGDDAAVRHHQEERMRVGRVLIMDVLPKVGLWIALEQIRDVERDGLLEMRGVLSRQRASRLRNGPHEEHALDDEHRGEKRHDAERNPPVEASIPVHRHRDKKMLIPNRGFHAGSSPAVTVFSFPASRSGSHNRLDAARA